MYALRACTAARDHFVCHVKRAMQSLAITRTPELPTCVTARIRREATDCNAVKHWRARFRSVMASLTQARTPACWMFDWSVGDESDPQILDWTDAHNDICDCGCGEGVDWDSVF
jgi:hypothetical protein